MRKEKAATPALSYPCQPHWLGWHSGQAIVATFSTTEPVLQKGLQAYGKVPLWATASSSAISWHHTFDVCDVFSEVTDLRLWLPCNIHMDIKWCHPLLEDKKSHHYWAWRYPKETIAGRDCTQLAVAQNKLLQKIEAQQQRLEEKIDRGFASFGSPIPELKKRISQLHEQILSLVQMRQDFSAQEREIKHLKVQLQSLEHQEQHPPSSVYPWSEPRSGPSPLLSLPKTTQAFKSVPDRQPGSSAFLFSSEEYAKRLKPLSGTPWSQPQQQRQDFPPYPTTRPQQSTVPPQSSSFQQNSRTDSCPLESSGPNQPFHILQSSTDSNPIAAYLQHMEGHDPVTDQVPTFEESEPESSEGSSEQEESPQTLPAMHMTQPSTSTYQEPIVTEPEADPIDQDPPVREPQMAKQTTSFTNVAFTLDPYPPEEWKQRIHQMYTWSMIELLKPNTNLQDIYKSIIVIVRFMGMLHTWWHNLGEYRQIQMLNSETLETFFGYILHEFVGDTRNHVDKQREEFFKLKCCSVKPKDLQQHFKRAALRFYEINGQDDQNVKQAYLNSIPEPLGREVLRLLEQNNLQLSNVTFGLLNQYIQKTLQKLCSNWKFMKEFQKTGKQIEKSCYRPDLLIKCSHRDSSCSCSTKKKLFTELLHKREQSSFYSMRYPPHLEVETSSSGTHTSNSGPSTAYSIE